MTYQARLVEPSASNKNYINVSYGGYNYCIHIRNGSVLPNCVGYAWGRWRELLGEYHKLSRGNAENWWANNDGYERGQTPKVGAVICWRKGQAFNAKDGAGHVAIVEKVHSDGSITISQSAYGGARFSTKVLKKPYIYGSAYTLQGFIYCPINFTEKTLDEVARDVLNGVYKTGATRKKLLEAEGYDYAQVQQKVNEILNAQITFAPGDKVKLTSDATYYNGGKIPAWLRLITLYVREVSGDRVVISTKKTGAVTGAVNKKYLKKV
jgi:surface antigen